MTNDKGITQYFGGNLAELLSHKIQEVYPSFKGDQYIQEAYGACECLGYTQRIGLHADLLKVYLPQDYLEAIDILKEILGPENPNETGMFSEFYWVMPLGRFVETYGLDHFEASIGAIEAITKRGTGEYAIRPFIRKFPHECLEVMKAMALSENFHLRRLASEGLRPKLPWATKLEVFIDQPHGVFEILELLKEDSVMFVKKSVANHLTDWLKVNPGPTEGLIRGWGLSDNRHTQWIIKRATRGHYVGET